MKRFLWLLLLGSFGLAAHSQSENTLLWRITGKNLARPSYLFGTIHMLCADDIQLSDSLRSAIGRADRVYLELDMDNLFEMVGAMKHMKMRGDTTLSDLLTREEYNKVKAYFDEHSRLIPFSMIESYKPMLAASTLMEQSMKSESCEKMVAMEQLIMKEAKSVGKGIRGLETMAYQLSIFDSIPYKLQAQQLVKMIDDADEKEGKKEIEEMTRAYRMQELHKLEEITNRDNMGVSNFTELLLYNRNRNWVRKLEELLPQNALVVAVGAGHLPGAQGVISLLRKAGYKVEPVRNDMIRRKTRDI